MGIRRSCENCSRGLEFRAGLRAGLCGVFGHGSCSAVPCGGRQALWQAPHVYVRGAMPTLRVNTWQLFFQTTRRQDTC